MADERALVVDPVRGSAEQRRLVAADIHSHIWGDGHLSDEFIADMRRAWPESRNVRADPVSHEQHAQLAARTVVLAFDAKHSGFCVPDEYVAEYVARDPQRLVGFCSIDPLRRDATKALDSAAALGLRGVKLAPTYQGFDPLSPEAFRMYEEIEGRGLPIVWHQGVTFVRRSILAYALPHQIDAVALRFPELRIVIAHLGHPWIAECIAVIRKHPNVYADISALYPRPIQFREALILVGEYRCAEKVLFGSDFPFGTIERTVSMLRGWADDNSEPAALRETAASLLTDDPLEVLGL